MGAPTSQDGQNLYRPEDVITPTVYAAPAADTPTPQDQPAAAPGTSDDHASRPAAEAVAPSPQAPVADMQNPAVITWSASEFVGHQKSSGWYAMLGVGAIMLAAIVWLLTRDFFPSIIVFAGITLLGVYSARKPHEETYTLDDYGVSVGRRRHSYHEFKSFTVTPEGAVLSVELTPLKRFATYTTLYLDPQTEDAVLDRLSEYLPMEESRTSLTDSVMRRMRL